VASIDIKKSV